MKIKELLFKINKLTEEGKITEDSKIYLIDFEGFFVKPDKMYADKTKDLLIQLEEL